jgi:cobalt-zinc-cadmium efflux system outer membrane protein
MQTTTAVVSAQAVHAVEELPPLPIIEQVSINKQNSTDIQQSNSTISQSLSLRQAEEIALQYHPGLAEALAQVNSLRGKWEQVGLAPNPYAGYSGQQTGSGNTVEQRGVVFGQEFVRGQKLELNRAIVQQEIQQAEQLLQAQRLRVLTDVRIAFLEVSTAQKRLNLSQEILQNNQKSWDASQLKFKAKEVGKSEILLGKIEYNAAFVQTQRAINQHQEIWRNLGSVMGVPQLPMTVIQDEINIELPDYTWESILEKLLRASPEVAAAEAEIQRTRWAYQRAQAEKKSNVSFQGLVQDDRSIDAVNGAVQVTLPIPLWNKNQGGIKQAGHDAIVAEQALEKLKLDLQHRLATVFQRYMTAKQQADVYAQQILPSAKENLELVRKAYQAGEYEYLQLLLAQRTFSQSNLDYLNAAQEARSVAFEIEGLLLSNGLKK